MIPSATLAIGASPRIQPQSQLVQKIDSVPEAAERAVRVLRTAEKYCLTDKIQGIRRKVEHEEGLMVEIGLIVGAPVFICISDSWKKLKGLLSRYRRQSRQMVQGFLAQAKEDFDKFRAKIANSVWKIWRVVTYEPNEEEELKQRQLRRRNHRWTAPKNVQPVFV